MNSAKDASLLTVLVLKQKRDCKLCTWNDYYHSWRALLEVCLLHRKKCKISAMQFIHHIPPPHTSTTKFIPIALSTNHEPTLFWMMSFINSKEWFWKDVRKLRNGNMNRTKNVHTFVINKKRVAKTVSGLTIFTWLIHYNSQMYHHKIRHCLEG